MELELIVPLKFRTPLEVGTYIRRAQLMIPEGVRFGKKAKLTFYIFTQEEIKRRADSFLSLF